MLNSSIVVRKELFYFCVDFGLKELWSSTASGTGAKCFPSISIHFGLKKGRREREKEKNDKSPCTSHKSNVFNIGKGFSLVFQIVLSNQWLLVLGSITFQTGWGKANRYITLSELLQLSSNGYLTLVCSWWQSVVCYVLLVKGLICCFLFSFYFFILLMYNYYKERIRKRIWDSEIVCTYVMEK